MPASAAVCQVIDGGREVGRRPVEPVERWWDLHGRALDRDAPGGQLADPRASEGGVGRQRGWLRVDQHDAVGAGERPHARPDPGVVLSGEDAAEH